MGNDMQHTQHKSDCATFNEPAYPNGPCDCGEIQWGWHDDSGSCQGPFDSKGEAIQDAEETLDLAPGEKMAITIGHAIYFNPVDHIGKCDCDDFLERMDEDAGEGYEFDDAIFETDDEGRIAFDEMLEQWCKKYVKVNYWHLENGEEYILIGLAEEEGKEQRNA